MLPTWLTRVLLPLALIPTAANICQAADSTNSASAKPQVLIEHTNEWGKAVGDTIEKTREQAEKGDAAAQFQLGFDYYVGQCIPTNYVEAVRWFRKAAEQGSARAQNYLGYCYLKGDGVERSISDGVKWYRKSAEQGDSESQLQMGIQYSAGGGVSIDQAQAVSWFRKAAAQSNSMAQTLLGQQYHLGRGVTKDFAEAMKWFSKAAEKEEPLALHWIGQMYFNGDGVLTDYAQAFKWLNRAAGKGAVLSQYHLGLMLGTGRGVGQDYIEGYKWLNVALSRGQTEWPNTNLFDQALKVRDALNLVMTPEQVAEGQRRASAFVPGLASGSPAQPASAKLIGEFAATASGSGFFITEDGFLVTNEHVVNGASQIRLVVGGQFIVATVVKLDAANDLALLKAEGKYSPLALVPSRSMRLGHTVATVGFPNIDLQGFAPKLAKGEIAALSGAQDDPRYFQVSLPVQPGNSGGALFDERGNVIGVVSAKLNVLEALAKSGEIPENVNYAVKSSFLLSFLEAVPDVSAKLKEPSADAPKFEDVVNSVERAAALVLCKAPAKVQPVRQIQSIPNIEQILPKASDVSSDHWIDSVLDDGNFVKLEDGSLWQISPVDTVTTSIWAGSTEITIIKLDNSTYPYKLINTDDNESVRARRVR